MTDKDKIAVIGIGCRFPGGIKGPESFWDLLVNGIDAITEVPADRFDINTYYDPKPQTPGKIVTRYGGFIDRVDKFDAEFFGISPREAHQMDPQQRLLAEVGWEAFEDAGITQSMLSKTKAAVYVGIYSNDYENRMFQNLSSIDLYAAIGGAHYSAAGRLSYLFDLKGPSVTVETACSSSLVAIHLACKGLWSGESQLAIAGGVNLILNPHHSIAYSNGGMLSPEGRCKFGDAEANGFARAEGCGLVILKPLLRALECNDKIYATILGSAINNDGRNGSIVAPSHEGQVAVQEEAYLDAGVPPGSAVYVEAHGTGTIVGDPVEMRSLGQVIGRQRPSGKPCLVGSVKSNFGHAETASGIAGLIKTALCLHHRKIPPSLHFKTPNREIQWNDLNLEIPVNLRNLAEEGSPAIAGINSFGLTGMNAHIVLQEFPTQTKDDTAQASMSLDSNRPYLLPVSAKCPESLSEMLGRWKQFLSAEDTKSAAPIHDICYSASLRRTHHEFRLAVVGQSKAELCEKLSDLQSAAQSPAIERMGSDGSTRGGLAFVFSGQGPQWFGMGRGLLEQEPVFLRTIERISRLLIAHAGWSLIDEMQADEATSKIDQTEVAQPALFALQMALAALWESWGIRPDAVVGHSIGEVAAACYSGVLSLEDAVRVVYNRGRLLQRCHGKGRMAAVGMPWEEAEALIADFAGQLTIAAINSPNSVTISGDPQALNGVLDVAAKRKCFYRILPVNYAFHSHHVEPFRDEMKRSVSGIATLAAAIPIVSTVSGKFAGAHDYGPEYWGENIRRTVRFAEAIGTLIHGGNLAFLEIGPSPVLLASISECLSSLSAHGTVLQSLRRGRNEMSTLLESLGTLYRKRLPVRWDAVYPAGGTAARLPLYAWNKRRFWIQTASRPYNPPPIRRRPNSDIPGALTGYRLSSPALRREVVEFCLEPEVLRGQDGWYAGSMLGWLPAYLLDLTLSAASESFGRQMHALEDVRVCREVFPQGDQPVTAQVIFNPVSAGEAAFEVACQRETLAGSSGEWDILVKGKLLLARHAASTGAPGSQLLPLDLAQIISGDNRLQTDRRRPVTAVGGDERIESISRSGAEIMARVRLPEAFARGAAPWRMPAFLLDTGIRILSEATTGEKQMFRAPHELVSVERLARWGWSHPVSAGWIRCSPLGEKRDEALEWDMMLYTDEGECIGKAERVRLKALDGTSMSDASAHDVEVCFFEMAWRPSEPPADSEKSARPVHQKEAARRPGPEIRPAADGEMAGRWLIFGDRAGVSHHVAKFLLDRGDECCIVVWGNDYEALPDGRIRMDPTRQDHFLRLAKDAFTESSKAGRKVLYLWGLNEEPPNSPAGDPGASTVSACVSLGSVIRLLANVEEVQAPRIWIATRGSQNVHPEEVTRLNQAPLWGMGRVLAAEHPGMWGGLIDLDPRESAAECARHLICHIDGSEGEDQVSFREAVRYVPFLAPPPKAHFAAVEWDPEAMYVISGGLGDLGLQTACWLAKQGARRLLLLGRTAVPDRSTWNQIGVDSPIFRRVRGILEVESLGATVKTCSVDIADEASLRGCLDKTRAEGWKPIRGLVHTAAVVHDQLLHQIEAAGIDQVFRPKLAGAWLLHRVLKDEPLDFFILYSSIGALFGQAGQGSYAAANAFLDALAGFRRSQGHPATSINWGLWSGFGLAAGAGARSTIDHLSEQGIMGMTAAQGTQAIHDVLSSGVTQAVVMAVDRKKFRKAFAAEDQPASLSRLARNLSDSATELRATQNAEDPDSVRQALFSTQVGKKRFQLLEGQLCDILVAVLKQDPSLISRDKPFNEMGLDSLMGIELKNRCEKRFGVALSATVAWNHPTIKALALHLSEKMGISLEEESGMPVQSAPRKLDADGSSDHPEGQSFSKALDVIRDMSEEDALKELLSKERYSGERRK